ncbi:hypothetical protein DRN86_01805 [Candidatus Geothermarchaeota archaeon]|nr:MAG: hypothetical protein DRN86_01805 [Candidatus Geothermarchaeota archaeon]
MLVFYDDIIREALNDRIPWKFAENGLKRLKILKSSVKMLERDTNIPYPAIVITPVLKILVHEAGVEAIIHGHIDFREDVRGNVVPVVNLSLPFLLNAKKHLYNYILAHEFLHYMFLAKKVVKADYFSLAQDLGETIISHMLFDESVKLDPKKVFKSRYILGLINKRYEKLINDEKFLKSIEENWVKRNLPTIFIPESQFLRRFTPSEFLKMKFPEEVVKAISKIA